MNVKCILYLLFIQAQQILLKLNVNPLTTATFETYVFDLFKRAQ